MCFESKVTWLSDTVNAAGYKRALVNGEYSGPVTYRADLLDLKKGDMVEVGISCKYDKERQREYINFIVLDKAVSFNG